MPTHARTHIAMHRTAQARIVTETDTSRFLTPPRSERQLTRDSGIASSRMPTQIMMAVFLSLFTWSPTAAAISSSSRMLSGTSSGVAVPGTLKTTAPQNRTSNPSAIEECSLGRPGAGIAPVSSRTWLRPDRHTQRRASHDGCVSGSYQVSGDAVVVGHFCRR